MESLAQQFEQWLVTIKSYPLLVAFLVAAVGLLVAKLAELFLTNIIGRMVAKTESKFDDKIISLLHKPIFTTFAIFGLIIASYSVAKELGNNFLPATLAILKSLIILSWIRFFMRSSDSVINSMGANKRNFSFAQEDTVPLLKNLAIVFLLLAGAYSILVTWDINVTGLVASAGIVGLALSFAAQDTLSHLFSGVAILADRPYRIGDFIVLDTGERGQVTHIGLRSTRLMTRDDVEVSIPNGVMGSAKIVNESGGGKSQYRVRAHVGVAYGSDVDKVLNVLETIAKDNKYLSKHPEPRARFRTFGASSLDFELLAWIEEPSVRGLRIHEINCEINRRFIEENIVIPFPQQDVWIKELPQERSNNEDSSFKDLDQKY
ncbi:MAG: mechanosensitive ion channel family protein [Gammaproteobacteria bacterium]|nr:mechanosensitive ion channel family protein [Gammaproteobacteria bacterium]MCP4090072.1 mechanosensitive ion channel family protein [Gammaproteobacteria bacterium]MCP4277038.1 mechanosensitive ion channel family protein [Gammaproteobacteria bacterium]MCP4832739.1 mechanosensitive ion channel family protein [Gammaproteobacteria bacterium]MCP4929932.1 mechanosensitive ion channel family protein [Gammaproteobacteria bacterium]